MKQKFAALFVLGNVLCLSAIAECTTHAPAKTYFHGRDATETIEKCENASRGSRECRENLGCSLNTGECDTYARTKTYFVGPDAQTTIDKCENATAGSRECQVNLGCSLRANNERSASGTASAGSSRDIFVTPDSITNPIPHSDEIDGATLQFRTRENIRIRAGATSVEFGRHCAAIVKAAAGYERVIPKGTLYTVPSIWTNSGTEMNRWAHLPISDSDTIEKIQCGTMSDTFTVKQLRRDLKKSAEILEFHGNFEPRSVR